MIDRLRSYAPMLITAVLVSTVFATGPTVAEAAQSVVNADKVDGRHAVGAGTSVARRKGKLVATSSTTGRLPNNIIAKAPDADRLDGLNSSDFLRRQPIVLSQQRGWAPQAGGGGSVQDYSNVEVLQGSTQYHLGLVTPARIGSTQFYLRKVELCYNAGNAGDKIAFTKIARLSTDNFADQEFTDNTERTAVFPTQECYTFTVNDTGAAPDSAYNLSVQVEGSVRVARVTSTFAPR